MILALIMALQENIQNQSENNTLEKLISQKAQFWTKNMGRVLLSIFKLVETLAGELVRSAGFEISVELVG